MKIGINTFGLNKLLAHDFEGTLKALKEMGIDAIEPGILFGGTKDVPVERMREGLRRAGMDGYMWLYDEAPGKIAKIRGMGFEVPGCHIVTLGGLQSGLGALLPDMKVFAEANDIHYYVYSPQKTCVEDAGQDAADFRRGIAELGEQGVSLLFHPHDHELKEDNGDRVFDFLLREVPELKVELDVGWLQYAGADVLSFMARYKDRIEIVHFKDIAEDACEENRDHCCTAIGEGTIPLKEILEEMKTLQLREAGYIIDQDSSRGDMLEDIRRGIENIRK